MAVTVFGVDEQDDHPVDVGRWVRLAEQVLEARDVRHTSELTLLFVDEATMADLNERHMGHPGPTDVLAFPIDDEPLAPGRWPDNGTSGPDRPPTEDIPSLLGDVVVCPAVAARQAPEHAGSYVDELALLIVHGILHVLGMDHADASEEAEMTAATKDLLGRFHTST